MYQFMIDTTHATSSIGSHKWCYQRKLRSLDEKKERSWPKDRLLGSCVTNLTYLELIYRNFDYKLIKTSIKLSKVKSLNERNKNLTLIECSNSKKASHEHSHKFWTRGKNHKKYEIDIKKRNSQLAGFENPKDPSQCKYCNSIFSLLFLFLTLKTLQDDS
jgi:ATP-dependent Zn protease